MEMDFPNSRLNLNRQDNLSVNYIPVRLQLVLLLLALGQTSIQAQKGEIENHNPSINTQLPGWHALEADDFKQVNSAPSTWSWKQDGLHCSGQPVSVLRTRKIYTNFEMVVEWSHQKAGGNSGVFVWATPDSIERLMSPDNPGPPLPDGIEIQMLDHAFTEQTRARGEPTDWFTTHGDVFPVRVKMTPFPPFSPVSEKRIITKNFGRGEFEIVGRETPGRSFPSKNLSNGHGEWNHYYIRAINGEVRLWVNGEEVSGGTNCDPSTGYICLESEGSPILFRNLRIRELP